MHLKVYLSAPLKELRGTWSFTGKTTVQGVLRFLICTVPPEILKTPPVVLLSDTVYNLRTLQSQRECWELFKV